jgi:hypothetical protein
MRNRWWLPAIAAMAGCASAAPAPPAPPAALSPSPPPSPAALLLTRADSLLEQGSYEAAMEAYGDFAREYPGDGATPRARATRDLLGSLSATSTEVHRINAEVLRIREQAEDSERELNQLRRELVARESELNRVRQELADRQAELARLVAETERLRTDLEKLKNVDLRLERRR